MSVGAGDREHIEFLSDESSSSHFTAETHSYVGWQSLVRCDVNCY